MASLLQASKSVTTAPNFGVSEAGVAWALDEADCKPSLRLTLVVIARAADKDGRASQQTVATIAEKTGKSFRQAQRDISDLLAAGLILPGDRSVVAHLPSGRRPMVYDLPLPTTSPISNQNSAPTPTSPELSTPMTLAVPEGCHRCDATGVVDDIKTREEENNNINNNKYINNKNSLSKSTGDTSAACHPEKKSINRGKQWLKKLVSIPDRALDQLGVPAPDRPGIIDHITKTHHVRGDGWWITASKNGTLVQRVQDAFNALKSLDSRPAEQVDLSKFPECSHGVPGGDRIRPKFGTPGCPQCRWAFQPQPALCVAASW